jgi:hypothetical protein
MDFNLHAFDKLLKSFLDKNYQFQTFYDFLVAPISKVVILRHDVDRLPYNALQTAVIEHQMGIKGTYYFRVVPESFNERIIKQIANLGHEIGYHYENMDSVSTRFRGKDIKFKNAEEKRVSIIDAAYEEFCENLERFRKIYPVKTICMHGSPRSKWDNKEIWRTYDYRKLGIIGEPYLDIDFNEVFYLTDTGRRWDGFRYSVRDRVPQQQKWIEKGLVFGTTLDIIEAVKENRFPEKAMITIHPQRWHNKPLPWMREWATQNIKNMAKYLLIKFRES